MKFILAILMFAGAAGAQHLYVYSDLQTDGAGNATATASSTTDYNTSYYYDLLANEWLWFRPDNSSSDNLVCSQGAATGYYNYVSVLCSGNVGSTSGTFTLESYHDLDTVYYYYQLQPCTWECSYYDDYYGYSFIYNPNYTDNTYIYAYDQATPIAQVTAINASLYKQAHQGSCVYPTSETTYGWGWDYAYWPYLGQFLQVLSGGTFNGRYVQEAFSGSPSDTCWRPQNGGTPITSNPSPGQWYVSSIVGAGTYSPYYLFSYSNGWGYDNLGFVGSNGSTRLYNYVTNMRPSNGMCSITYTQNMYMFCSGFSGAGQYYTTYNPLAIYIAATPSAASLTVSRSGNQIQRDYP
jgi:hypothetical protein